MTIFQTEMQHGFPRERNSNLKAAFFYFFLFKNFQTFYPIDHGLVFIELVNHYLLIRLYIFCFLFSFGCWIFFLFFFHFFLFYFWFYLICLVFIWDFWRGTTSMRFLKLCWSSWIYRKIPIIFLIWTFRSWNWSWLLKFFIFLRCFTPLLWISSFCRQFCRFRKCHIIHFLTIINYNQN